MFTTLASSHQGGPAATTTAQHPTALATVRPAEKLRPDTSHGVARMGAAGVAVAYLLLLMSY